MAAHHKKRVRARVKEKSRNNSVLDDSVDQFLRDEQLVHQAISIGSLGDSGINTTGNLNVLECI
jgi:hypothetical protein